MACNFSKSLALSLVLNLLFFTLISACDCGTGTTLTPKPKTKAPTTPKTTVPKHTVPKPAPTGGSSSQSCPIDVLKLGSCANVLNGLINIPILLGAPPKQPCCSLVQGLIDTDAAVCLCTAIKANILGINLNVPISLSLLVNYCGDKLPSGFQCA